MLTIQGLRKSFGTKEVLHGIDLQVNNGEIFGFIGHNGAGKTTTLRCTAGILSFNDGKILINGTDLQKAPVKAKMQMAYLPDNPDLYEQLTGIKFLNFICDMYDVPQNVREERIRSLAEDFEIYANLGDPLKSYSHGMKQKTAVIAALIHEPKLLILDEPFVGLDPKASYLLKQKMKELCAGGSSIFFSSHVLEVVENLCDRIAILRQGEIVMSGTADEILAQGQSLEDLFLELENVG